MVFQNYALYPHMSVAENMSFALKLRGIGKRATDGPVLAAAKLLDLRDYLDRTPKGVTGGQRQRGGLRGVAGTSRELPDQPVNAFVAGSSASRATG
jgi:ABC-type sugar transport system ATPase subunit